ncbi:MAG: hypothetical protein V4681_00305 [Patescibacteria group bacterium]
MNKYLIVGVVAILVVAGGWWYVTQPHAMEQRTREAGPNRTYAYENSDSLESLKSPTGKYAIMYDAQSKSSFRIVDTSTKKVLSDYTPKTGSAIICEMVCYPFALWMDDTKLVIGSYSLVNRAWGPDNPAKRHETVVFDVSTETYRVATELEINQSGLYSDKNLPFE